MKGKILSFLGLLLFIVLCVTGWIQEIIKVFVWLFNLKLNTPDISIFGLILVKYGTWLITFTSIDIIFKTLGLSNGKTMKLAYFILSTMISFGLSWVVMNIEKNLSIIAIIIGCFICISILIGIIWLIIDRLDSLRMKGAK